MNEGVMHLQRKKRSRVIILSALFFVLSLPVSAHNSDGTVSDMEETELHAPVNIGSSFSTVFDTSTATQGLTVEEVQFENGHDIANENQRTKIKLFVLSVFIALTALNMFFSRTEQFFRYIKRINMITGVLILNMLLVLILSGIVLSFGYMPFPTLAYGSVVQISQSSLLGFVRNVHYWATDVLMMLTFLHLTRVVFSKVVDTKKRFAYWSGLTLFVLVGITALLGTFMRSDQEAFEAYAHVWVGTQQYLPLILQQVLVFVGGGDFSLLRFYILHSIVLPSAMLLLLLLHAYVAKSFRGVISQIQITAQRIKGVAKKSTTIFPQLRIIGYATVVQLFVLTTLALLLPAPLFSRAYNGLEITRPPWYLLWVYGFENVWGMSTLILVPLLSLALFIVLPFFSTERRKIDAATILYILILFGFFGFSFYAILGEATTHLTMVQTVL